MPDIAETKAFLDHIYAAHRKLDHLRRVLAETLQQLPAGSSLTGIAEQLRVLYGELAGHFREEEQGGCLEEAVFHCPSQGPRMVALAREHGELLSALEDLLKRCSPVSAVAEPAISAAFAAWSEALRLHEQGEDELIAQAFGVSLPSDEGC